MWLGLVSMAPSTDPQITKSTYRCGSEHSHTSCACLRPDLVFILCQQVGTGAGLIWYVLSLQIIHTDSNTVLGQNDTGFSCDGSANTFRVMFKEPVEILPNVNYTACATLKVCVASHQTSTAQGRFLQVIYPPPPTFCCTGSRLPLWYERNAKGNARVFVHWHEDVLHLLLRGGKQQRHFRGGRTDPRGHLLYIVTFVESAMSHQM